MKRFDMEIQPQRYYMGEGESYAVSPYESTKGDWVKWDDVAKLEAQRDELLAMLQEFLKFDDKCPCEVSDEAIALYSKADGVIAKVTKELQ